MGNLKGCKRLNESYLLANTIVAVPGQCTRSLDQAYHCCQHDWFMCTRVPGKLLWEVDPWEL